LTALGAARVSAGGAFKGNALLKLARPIERINEETSARGAAFDASGGAWQLSGACKSDLHSPDNSYHGAVSLEALGPGDAVIERISLHEQTGTSTWGTFSTQVELPKNTVRARFVVELRKTYGTLLVDELAAASVASADAAEKLVDKIFLPTGAVGNLLMPDDRPLINATVEAIKPLPKDERRLTYVVTDYWGAEQGDAITVELVRKGRNGDRFVYAADLDLASFHLDLYKYYEVRVSIERAAGEPYQEFTGIARLPLAESKKHKPEEIPFTIRNWDNRIPEYIYLSDRVGIRSIGVWGGWSEKPPYEPFVPSIEHVKKVGAIWVTGTPASSIESEGFATFSEEALRQGMKNFLNRFAHQGMAMMCLGNEPHARDMDHVKEMVRGYRALYEAAKEFDPKTFVIGTSIPPDRRYFEAGCYKYLDAYDYHVYETYNDVRRSIQEYRVLVQLVGRSGAPSGELIVHTPITSPLAISVHPLPAAAGAPERLEVRIRNSGRDAVHVRWDVALTEELPMKRGRYDLKAGQPASAYFTGSIEGQLMLAGLEEKRIRIELADTDPSTIYRVQATLRDPLGRTVSSESLVGGFARAAKTASPPTIDGALGEKQWAGASVCRIADGRQYYPLSDNASVEQFWTGADDLSATLRFLWDDTNLYLGVSVKDDVFRAPKSDGELWQQDGLQFLMDPSRGRPENAGRYDYTVGLGVKGPQAWCINSATSTVLAGPVVGIRVAAKRAGDADGSVTYEIAIPWTHLAPFEPDLGGDLGLSMILNEDDGEGRQSFMGWFGGVHSKQLDMAGDVILVEGE
jgi:hypothetical protein